METRPDARLYQKRLRCLLSFWHVDSSFHLLKQSWSWSCHKEFCRDVRVKLLRAPSTGWTQNAVSFPRLHEQSLKATFVHTAPCSSVLVIKGSRVSSRTVCEHISWVPLFASENRIWGAAFSNYTAYILLTVGQMGHLFLDTKAILATVATQRCSRNIWSWVYKQLPKGLNIYSAFYQTYIYICVYSFNFT